MSEQMNSCLKISVFSEGKTRCLFREKFGECACLFDCYCNDPLYQVEWDGTVTKKWPRVQQVSEAIDFWIDERTPKYSIDRVTGEKFRDD